VDKVTADARVAELARLDAAAVRASMDAAVTVSDADLDRVTPCAGWTVADLLAHMTAQHEGFAAAAMGDGADLDRWRTRPWATAAALVAGYAAASVLVIEAFAADGIADRAFDLPEISFPGPFPARHAIGFHLVDYVAHGWDLARSLGLDYEGLDPDILAAALVIARTVPEGDHRLRPDAAFAPRVNTTPTTPLNQILALLGRHPAWPPSST
jgi:uncharacterized protein (TIGR03086 family)